MSAFTVGIDMGGTFTDFFVLSDAADVRMFKTPTVPEDPVRGIIAGLTGVAEIFGEPLAQFLSNTKHIVHGTTVATNAVLTGQGVKTGLLTTAGFRDSLEMRRGHRKLIFDHSRPPIEPLVPRSRRVGLTERVGSDGRVAVSLSLDQVRAALAKFVQENVKAVAVNLLFSFLNPIHERAIAECAANEFPQLYLSISSQVLPEIGEYERTSTVVANAFVGPIISTYLRRLEHELHAIGFAGTVFLMQSNGGLASIATTCSKPVTTVLSGPASAPAAATFFCEMYGIKDVITADMGGTSFDACLLKDGNPHLTYDGELGGHRIKMPMVDVDVMGAGGGSIAWLDNGGLLRVGPRSAGAAPGPACYGAGGAEPTVTDANLILGYLDPDFFLGGRLVLDRQAASRAIETRIAQPLGLSVIEAAWGIVRVVTSNMADGIEKISVRRGFDPREFHLIVGGGAGPTHAGLIAQEMDISRIFIPASASVLCAFGMLASALKHCYVRTCMFAVSTIADSPARGIWREMHDDALATLAREGADPATVRFTYSADIRYLGQAYEIEVELEEDVALHAEPARIAERFHDAHDAIYGYAERSVDVECVNVRLTATTARRKIALPRLPYASEDPEPARKGYRSAYFEVHGMVDTPVFDGTRLAVGNVIEGPALIERTDTTVVVPSSFRLVCDEWGNYQMLSRRGEQSA